MFFITKKKEDILLILMSFIILLIIPVIYFSVENAIETIKYSGLSRTERIHHLLDQKEMTGDINTEVKNYILSTQHLQPEMYIPVTTIYTGGNFENHSFKGKTVIHWYYIKKRNVKKLYYMKFRIDSNYRATDVTITSYDSSLFDHSANIDTTAINAAVKLDAAAVK
jgi:hypothetical protein